MKIFLAFVLGGYLTLQVPAVASLVGDMTQWFFGYFPAIPQMLDGLLNYLAATPTEPM